MMLDRSEPDSLLPTPELLGTLLRVTGPQVAEVVASLESEGLLRQTDAGLVAADRQRLEQRVCDCYAAVTAEYEALLPQPG